MKTCGAYCYGQFTRAHFDVVAIAASAGGLLPLKMALAELPRDFPAAVIVLMHRSPESRLPEYLRHRIALPVRQAAERDYLRPGVVLVAPPRIHMTIDSEARVRLLDTMPIKFIRPRADVLFRSLADVFGKRTVAVVLSGFGDDGTAGSRAIRAAGGVVLAQDPRTSERSEMPISAVDVGKVDVVLRSDQIGPALRALAGGGRVRADSRLIAIRIKLDKSVGGESGGA